MASSSLVYYTVNELQLGVNVVGWLLTGNYREKWSRGRDPGRALGSITGIEP